MTVPPQGDPFVKSPESGAWTEPTKPNAPPASPGYAIPPPPGPAAPGPTMPGPTMPGATAPGPIAAPVGYYPYGYPPQKTPKPKSWMNIVSLSAVGAGLFIPFLANVAGIVFGHLGRRAAKRGEADYAGVGLAGLILNYIAAILWAVGIIAYIAFIAWMINECATDPYGEFCSGSSY